MYASIRERATKIDAHREWFRKIPPHSASLSQAHCAMFAEQCSVFTSTHATENYCCLWTKFRSRARVVCIMAVAHEVICQMKFIAISSDGNYIHQESCTRSKAAAVENKKFKIGLNERSTQWIQIIVVALGWRLYAVPVDVNVKLKHSKATINSTVFFFCFVLFFFCFTAYEKCVYDFRPNNSQYGPVLRMLFQRIRRSLFLSLSLSHSFANNNNNWFVASCDCCYTDYLIRLG